MEKPSLLQLTLLGPYILRLLELLCHFSVLLFSSNHLKVFFFLSILVSLGLKFDHIFICSFQFHCLCSFSLCSSFICFCSKQFCFPLLCIKSFLEMINFAFFYLGLALSILSCFLYFFEELLFLFCQVVNSTNHLFFVVSCLCKSFCRTSFWASVVQTIESAFTVSRWFRCHAIVGNRSCWVICTDWFVIHC